MSSTKLQPFCSGQFVYHISLISEMVFIRTVTPYSLSYISLLACVLVYLRMKVKLILNDDVIKWRHFPCYWPFVRGIHRSPVNSPHKGQCRGVLLFSLICTWINNRKAGDLRRHRAHYDVIVICLLLLSGECWPFVWDTYLHCRAEIWGPLYQHGLTLIPAWNG